MTSDTDIAWAAGIIDGEGCIWTRWPKRANVCLEVKMIHRPTLEKLHALFGGRLTEAYERRRGRRTQWRWCAETMVAERALKRMLPHLVTKKVQAMAALNIIASSAKTDTGRANRDAWKSVLDIEKAATYEPEAYL